MTVDEIIDYMEGLSSNEREALALSIVDSCAPRVAASDVIAGIAQCHQERYAYMCDYFEPDEVLELYCDMYSFEALVDCLRERQA